MSALPKSQTERGFSGLLGLRMKADEFLAAGETAERFELVDGVVIMSPSPTFLHQLLTAEITGQVWTQQKAIPGMLVANDVDIRLSDRLVYRPDVSVFGPGAISSVPELVTTPPQLIVEVLSPRTRLFDLVTKRDDYAKFGVDEYLVIDPTNGDVRRWTRIQAKFEEAPISSTRLELASIPGLSLDLAPIRALIAKAGN